MLGRLETALSIQQGVYSGYVKLYGKQHRSTLLVANNYALSLCKLGRLEEAKSWLRKMIPMALRALGETDEVTLNLRKFYAQSLYLDSESTLDDLGEALNTLEDAERIARRVLGGAHPTTARIEGDLRKARAITVLRAREAPRRE